MKTFLISRLTALVVMMVMAMASVCATASESADADSIVFTYCNESASLDGGGSSADRLIGAAMLFTDELAMRFGSCKIVAVDIANGRFDTQKEAPLTIFFTRELNEEPFRTEPGEMDTDNPYVFKRYELTQPVDISSDSFYIGYTIHEEASDFEASIFNASLMKDGISHNDYPGGFYGYSPSGNPEDMIWADEGRTFGQFAIRLVIVGENMPQYTAEITDINFPYYVEPGVSGSGYVTLHNTGTTPIDSVEIEYGFAGNMHKETIDLEPVGFNKYQDIHFQAMSEEQDVCCNLVVNILKINDMPVSGLSAATDVRCFDANLGYTRNMLVEEGTGQGCGWCVRGIVGMNRMLETHSDGSFIPVAVFYDYGTQITGNSYDDLWEEYLTHLPSCLVNRDLRGYGISDPGSLEYAWETETSIPATVDISDVRMEIDGNRCIASAEAVYAFDEHDTDYRMAFIITEDNVGPYWQYNEYSGWDLDMDGWESLPEYVSDAYYNHVARDISNFRGEPFTPGDVTANTVYTHTATLDLSLVANPENCHVIAVIINGKNNHVENAKSVSLAEVCGVETPMIDNASQPVEYYNLNGTRVNNPGSTGIYIRRQGHMTTKVVL